MDTNIEVRGYRPEDAPALSEIAKKVYGIEHDVRLWKWKYEDNPLKKNFSYVAIADGRIVAHSGGLCTELQIRGEKFPAQQLCDLMSDPEHRVKGAFTMAYVMMISTSVEQDCCPYGFANPQSAGFTVGMKFNVLGPMIPRLDRIVSAEPFLRRKVKSPLIARIAAVPANLGIKLYYRSSLKSGETDSIREIDSFDERFDRLWNKIASGFPRTPVRSSEYLEWRYRKHPTNQYKIFGYFQRGELAGFIVLTSIDRKSVRRGLIIDLVTVLDRPEVWEALLARGISYLMDDGADLITCWMFDHMPYYETLMDMSFVSRPSNLNVNIHGEVGKHDVDSLNDPKDWHVSMGDSDMW